MRPLNLFLASAAVSSLGFAQAQLPADEMRKFEVASVRLHETKPSDAGQWQALALRINGSRVNVYQVNVGNLVKLAFGLEAYQIVGGPEWLRSVRDVYDIQASTTDVPTEAQVRVMLQNLLAERFKLTYHREPRELSVYPLFVGKNGSKLRPSAEGVIWNHGWAREYEVHWHFW